MKNKQGLDRYIPEDVKHVVRKRCGFGCVECGSAIYQYHHFNPPFEEAKTHDPNGITLLCGNKHDEVHRGLLSNGEVSFYNSNPKCLSKGFSCFTSHGLGPVVVLGSNTFINNPNIIIGFGQPLLVIEAPEEQNAPFRLSALFQDQSGKEIARIDQNEWKGSSDNWDIQTSGTRFTIRQKPRSIDLEINITPGKW